MSKTLRQFQCRDDLWTRVEALAKRRGISPDDIIQAALLQLFKSGKKKESNEDTPPPPPARAAASSAATTPRPGPPPSASTAQRPVPRGLPRPTSAPAPAPGASASGVKPSLPRPTSSSPRLPPPSSASRAQPQTRPLYLCFENQWYVVDKEEFVIGRGAKYSDLPIKDANISRRHCAIVRRGADYFIKDLGSTNGVEFGGERVDNHRIAEGSVYYLCDHELRFSFNAPA